MSRCELRGQRRIQRLGFTAEVPCINLVLLLLANSASVKASPKANYPLESVSDINIVRVLLEHGADPYAKGASGVRPIENARCLRDECLEDGDVENAKHFEAVLVMMENWRAGHG